MTKPNDFKERDYPVLICPNTSDRDALHISRGTVGQSFYTDCGMAIRFIKRAVELPNGATRPTLCPACGTKEDFEKADADNKEAIRRGWEVYYQRQAEEDRQWQEFRAERAIRLADLVAHLRAQGFEATAETDKACIVYGGRQYAVIEEG